MTAFDKPWQVFSPTTIHREETGGPRADCPDCKGEGYIRMASLTFRCERCPKWSSEK